ncbi:MAG: hypothetical protein A2516_08800 [Alphaproteobacteria bacterium RIFOXYD12_FULL_60_8]|nr:MAG: hypothetical protein A2516_08800 [Alphaproteobacteria bacterium RIFOXYD12_FULL_60_8]
MKLGLGTVQFGMDYAIDVNERRPDDRQVGEILDLAYKNGVRVLDTASLYGNSESVLGRNMQQNFRVVTKTPAFGQGHFGAQEAKVLRQTFLHSLENLRLSKVAALMAHRADDLLAPGGQHLFEAMLTLKNEGLVEKIGVSVYTGEQIDGLLECYNLDCIQVPVSLFDQRLIQSGHLTALKELGIEVHSRSSFLKGLIFQNPEVLPDHFVGAKAQLRAFRALTAEHGVTPLVGALSFILAQKEVDVVLCGVTSRAQLEEILEAAQSPITADMSSFALTDVNILNPGRWPDYKL